MARWDKSRPRAAAWVTAAALGVYAGLLGMIHGVCELLQGAGEPEGLVFYAVGPPCEPEAVWHGCLPAMTVLPGLLWAGIATVLASLALILWAVWGKKRHGAGLIVLSVLLMLAGGGFVAPFAGIMAGIAGMRSGKSKSPVGAVRCFLAKMWPWPLCIVLVWLPAGWVFGYFFNEAMLAVSTLLFVLFDILMPVLALWSGLARDRIDWVA